MNENEVNENNIKLTPYNLFPEDHKYLTFLKKVFRHEFRKNGFKRLSTTMMRKKDFYEKIFGDRVDEYVFSLDIKDVGDFCFKPNPSISALKTYIDGNLKEKIQPIYNYYMDRFYPKQSNKVEGVGLFGADVIGEDDPIIDAQMIYIINIILKKIGLSDMFEIRINSLGSKKEQLKYSEELISFYDNKKHLLTDKGLDKLEKNPIELLASDNEDEVILAQSAPKITKFHKKDSKKHYSQFKEYLSLLNIDFIEDSTLIGDYNYINNSVWEFRIKETGEKIGGGYRYNTLSLLIGEDKEIPASGFNIDIFKIVDLLKHKEIGIKNKDKLQLYFVQLGDEAKKVVLPISLQARDAGINTAVSLGTPSMKEQMLKANKSGANFVVLVGFMEAKSGIFQVRDLENGSQEEVKKEELINYIIEKIGKNNLDFYEPSKDLLK